MEARLRVWSEIQTRVSVDAETGCHLWLGGKNDKGYGSILREEVRKSPIYVHRLALEVALNRPLLRLELALHRCHVPHCVNAAHLRVGSSKDNSRDMNLANRNTNRKLVPEEAARIRELYADGKATQERLAAMFAVSRSAVRHVLDNQTYVEHIGAAPAVLEAFNKPTRPARAPVSTPAPKYRVFSIHRYPIEFTEEELAARTGKVFTPKTDGASAKQPNFADSK